MPRGRPDLLGRVGKMINLDEECLTELRKLQRAGESFSSLVNRMLWVGLKTHGVTKPKSF